MNRKQRRAHKAQMRKQFKHVLKWTAKKSNLKTTENKSC